MSSLALDLPLEAEARDCLDTVKTAADSLLSLVNDILDFSRIEAGGIRLELSDFHLRSLQKNALDVIQPLATAKNIRLVPAQSAALSSAVRGDPGRVLQVLLNLLGNAVKFTPKGGEVSLFFGEAAPGRFRFRVRDSGIGVEDQVRGALFRPFSQADASTARKFGGTGLGLSICKKLVGLMQGEIGFESEPGKGSEFWFEIPLAAAETALDALEEEVEPAAPAARASARVLVADDNPANQKVILRLLEKLGYAPEMVTNGREALEACRARRFDLVLMDCQMPEMDGYEATRKIRTLPGQAGRTPVIALTAHALAGEREKCRAAGMDGYLSKPVSLHELGRAMARYTRAGGESPLDKKYLESLSQLNSPGKPDILGELAAIFVETGPAKLAAIREAMKNGAADKLRFEAHSLKSTCHNVGAVRAARLCGELEALAEKEKDLTGIELLVARLERETP